MRDRRHGGGWKACGAMLILGCGGDDPGKGADTDVTSTEDSDGPRSDDTGTTLPADAPAVIRVGPPAAAAGIYGIAADAEHVYVANLHVPFLILADPNTGAWDDAVDLREVGITASFFPRLFLFDDRLWITQQNEDRLVRLAVPEGTLDGDIHTDRAYGGVATDGHTLYASLVSEEIVGYDGHTGAEVSRVPAPRGSAIAADGAHYAVLDAPSQSVTLLERDGTVVWSVVLADRTGLNDIALFEGSVFVTDRISGDVIELADGAEVGSVHTGSDTFALFPLEGTLYVTNRQGAALSSAGAYDGTPARITALNADLDVLWTVDLAKTIHWLAWDGRRIWAANEDSLQLSAVDPTTHGEVVRGPHLGLTLDSITSDGATIYAGSHLTDEVWRMGFGDGGRADGAAVCGWPFVAVPLGGTLGVPCQESGDVAMLDADTLTVTELRDVAPTFHVPCPDGLCTGHKQFLSATNDAGTLVWTEPASATLHWWDDRTLTVRDTVDFAEKIHHFDVKVLDGGLVVYEPIDQRVLRVVDGAVTASVDAPDVEAAFPVVVDGDRFWVGSTAYDADFQPVATVAGGDVVAAGEGVVVVQDGEDLVVYADGIEAARMSAYDLVSPPTVTLAGDPSPLRFGVVEGELIIANTFHGTLERRRLADLGPLGAGTVAVGTWADR